MSEIEPHPLLSSPQYKSMELLVSAFVSRRGEVARKVELVKNTEKEIALLEEEMIGLWRTLKSLGLPDEITVDSRFWGNSGCLLSAELFQLQLEGSQKDSPSQ